MMNYLEYYDDFIKSPINQTSPPISFNNLFSFSQSNFEQILPELSENMLECYADKAYQVKAEAIHQEQHVTLLTPVKKEKGQAFLDAADQWLSTAISQVHQPIESLFNSGLMRKQVSKLQVKLALIKD